jgi:hypothetical protein
VKKTPRLAVLLSGVVFLFILTAPTPLKADEWDLATVFSVNQPVEVPGKVLEPNTKYLIKLFDSPAQRSVVQVFDEHRQHLYTTFFGVPKYRPEATDHTTFEFMEVPAGNPMPIRAWYYPGRIKGLEFMYPKKQLEKIAGYTSKTSASLIESASAAPVKTESESAAVVEQKEVVNEPPAQIAQNEQPQIEQRSESTEVQKSESTDIERSKPTEPEQAATTPAERSPSELPKTADVTALFALAGALSLGLGVGARAWRK